jgi:hypothetical protein
LGRRVFARHRRHFGLEVLIAKVDVERGRIGAEKPDRSGKIGNGSNGADLESGIGQSSGQAADGRSQCAASPHGVAPTMRFGAAAAVRHPSTKTTG